MSTQIPTGRPSLKGMSPEQAGEYLASLTPPITREQAEAAARILAPLQPVLEVKKSA